jgi:hypothetical protein
VVSLPTHLVGVYGPSLCMGPEERRSNMWGSDYAQAPERPDGDNQTRRFTNERHCLCGFPLSLSINRSSLLRTRGEGNSTKTVDTYKGVH